MGQLDRSLTLFQSDIPMSSLETIHRANSLPFIPEGDGRNAKHEYRDQLAVLEDARYRSFRNWRPGESLLFNTSEMKPPFNRSVSSTLAQYLQNTYCKLVIRKYHSMVSRRKLLKASGGVLALSSLAGCSYYEEERYTTVNVGNRTQQRQLISVAAFDPDSDTRSPLFGKNIELPPAGEGDEDTEVFEEAFESQRAIIEVEMGNLQQQFIYQPSSGCSEREEDGYLWIRFQTPSTVTWDIGCEGE